MRHSNIEPTDPKSRKRVASEFLTLLLFFGTLYTGVLMAHAYGL